MHDFREACFSDRGCFSQFCRVFTLGAAGTVSGDSPCHRERNHVRHDFSELPFFVCDEPGCFGVSVVFTLFGRCHRAFRFCRLVFSPV